MTTRNEEGKEAESSGSGVRDALVKGKESGKLLGALAEVWSKGSVDEEALAREIAAMHNEGLVDAVDVFSSLRNNGHMFFSLRHIFEVALPHLEVDVIRVVRCVQHLVREAGHDLAAGTIVDGFVEFIRTQPGRAEIALKAVEEEPDLTGMLPAVLISGSQSDIDKFAKETLRLMDADDPETRKQAVFALGKLEWAAGQSPAEEIFVAIEDANANEQRDELLGSIASTAVRLIKHDAAKEERMIAVLDSALAKGGEISLHAASVLIAHAEKETSDSLIDVLLEHIHGINPANKGTVDNVDHGLYRMIKRGEESKVLSFMEKFLVAHGDALEVTALDSALREIQQSAALRNKVATRWLLTGEPRLCKAAEWIVGGGHGANLVVDVDSTELDGTNRVHVLFLAKKIVGYLFFNPVSAASMLVSLMRLVDDETLVAELGNLLLDPILLNFPGKPGSLVEEQQKSGSETFRQTVKQVQDALEAYFSDLRSIRDLPELHPSEEQRESYQRHSSREMTESMKKAEEKSVLLNLFTRQTLLYGRASITYVHDRAGASHRREMPLQAHTVEFEYPRVAHLDPIGLDHQLMQYRAERWRK